MSTYPEDFIEKGGVSMTEEGGKKSEEAEININMEWLTWSQYLKNLFYRRRQLTENEAAPFRINVSLVKPRTQSKIFSLC